MSAIFETRCRNITLHEVETNNGTTVLSKEFPPKMSVFLQVSAVSDFVRLLQLFSYL